MAAPAALPATAVMEMRTTGGADHGGIFDSANPGGVGVDYSNQDDPVVSRTNFTCTTGGTTLVTATAATFTAAMVNNWIYLSGTHFTTGRRKIVTVIDQYSVTLCSDPTDGTNGTAGTGNVGGAIYEVNGTNLTALGLVIQAGNKIWIKGTTADNTTQATYSLTTANWTAGTTGTLALPVSIEGYGVTRGDRPTGTSGASARPIIDQAARTWGRHHYWNLSYLYMKGTADSGNASADPSYSYFRNCRFEGNSTTTARTFSIHATGDRSISCEFTSFAGTGVNTSISTAFVACWFHDGLAGGGIVTGYDVIFLSCLFEALTTGVSMTTGHTNRVLNCTFMGCGTGILWTGASDSHLIANDVCAYCTTGISSSGGTNYLNTLLDYNNFYGNGADVTNVTKGPHDTAYDPAFQGLRSWTDLVVSHTDNKVLTSATGGLSTYYQVGDYMWIDAHTGWTSGAYRITAVSAGGCTLATSPAAVDSTGGVARTCRISVGVSDVRLGTASSCRGAGLALALGVGS